MKDSDSRSRTVSTRAVVAVIFVLFAMGLPLVGASTASAEFIGDLITIEVDSIHGHGSVLFNSHIPPHALERVQAAMARRVVHDDDSGEVLGTIDWLNIDFDGDPLVDISFSAMAGAADTTFTITSALIQFPELTDPGAMTSASFALSDTGGLPGAFLGAATGAYRAEYNDGYLFRESIGDFSFDTAGATVISADDFGPVTLSGAVTSIRGKLAFTVSAGDSVSGSTRFEVTPTNGGAVPEPSTWAMMVMAAIGLLACGPRLRRLW